MYCTRDKKKLYINIVKKINRIIKVRSERNNERKYLRKNDFVDLCKLRLEREKNSSEIFYIHNNKRL